MSNIVFDASFLWDLFKSYLRKRYDIENFFDATKEQIDEAHLAVNALYLVILESALKEGLSRYNLFQKRKPGRPRKTNKGRKRKGDKL